MAEQIEMQFGMLRWVGPGNMYFTPSDMKLNFNF